MSVMQTIGTCSNCGGEVVVPLVWHGIIPPVPVCSRCGAVAANRGPVIPMVPPTQSPYKWEGDTTDNTWALPGGSKPTAKLED